MKGVKVISKKGHLWYNYHIPLDWPRKGRLAISKSGRIYRIYYVKKVGVRGYCIKITRRQRIALDSNICQECGSSQNIDVHHIDKCGPHKVANPNNEIDNLITLCHRCHMRLHFTTNDRNEMLYCLRQEGKTFAEIGERFKLSRQRIHQIVTRLKIFLRNHQR